MSFGKYLLTVGFAITIGLADGLSQSNEIKVVKGAGTRYNVTQKRAERDIAKLSLTADEEDSWIYLKGALIDDGIEENSESVFMNLPLIEKTDNGDTVKIIINNGDTITSYHNHIRHAPPGMYDIVNHSLLVDSLFANNHVISKVADNGRMWEFSIEDKLKSEFHGKSAKERFEILESKINKAYNKVDNYFLVGPIQSAYHPEPSSKGYREYRRIMNKVGVKTKYYRPK